MTQYGKTTACSVFCVHVKVKSVDASAKDMIKAISDVSWISKLDAVSQITFKARSKRTIEKLVREFGTVTFLF